jgi:hypothetical protein
MIENPVLHRLDTAGVAGARADKSLRIFSSRPEAKAALLET